MNNIMRFINQNRKQIIIIVIAIVFVLIFIRIMNNYARDSNQNKIDRYNNSDIINSIYIQDITNPIISGENIDTSTAKTANNQIVTFIENCNNGEVEAAYELLSSDCKEELYPTLEIFRQVYYNNNFDTQKKYSISLWMSKTLTYRVDMYEDPLITGAVNTGTKIQDYFTVINENGNKKLNISEYIGKVELERTKTLNNITILANYKNVYKDYEIYNITVKNSTNNEILLDSGESTKTIYLLGNNGVKYTSYAYEINKNSLQIKKGYSSTLDIKFNKQNANTYISSICFSDIILNNEEYSGMINKKEYENRIEIQLDL